MSAAEEQVRLEAIRALQGVRERLEPISTLCILFGSRASGRARPDSDYDLFVVARDPAAVERAAAAHPFAASHELEIVAWTPEMFEDIRNSDPQLADKLQAGVTLW